jgi:hypothetical protein
VIGVKSGVGGGGSGVVWAAPCPWSPDFDPQPLSAAAATRARSTMTTLVILIEPPPGQILSFFSAWS